MVALLGIVVSCALTLFYGMATTRGYGALPPTLVLLLGLYWLGTLWSRAARNTVRKRTLEEIDAIHTHCLKELRNQLALVQERLSLGTAHAPN
jgi:hypothetical protein